MLWLQLTKAINNQQKLRDNEVAIDVPSRRDAELIFIGQIKTPFETLYDCPRQGDKEQGPLVDIEVFAPWCDALDGIERHETLDILYWLHQSRRDLLKQTPNKDGQPLSTFSLRSPIRPNPIGVSTVKLIARKGNILTVRGLDCLNMTPLIDIKPSLKTNAPSTHSGAHKADSAK